MNLPISVTQSDLLEVLLNVAPVRPVFIWGAPGIGKSALVEQFAEEVGLPCVSLLGILKMICLFIMSMRISFLKEVNCRFAQKERCFISNSKFRVLHNSVALQPFQCMLECNYIRWI